MRTKTIVKPVPEINMIPMIDVIMMLLIFFLVATQMKKEGLNGDVTLPDSQAAKPVTEDSGPMTVNILSTKLGGALPYRMENRDEALGKEDLTRRMQEYALVCRSVSGREPIVRIRADRDSELHSLQDALISCRQAGVWRVLLGAASATRTPANAEPTGGH